MCKDRDFSKGPLTISFRIDLAKELLDIVKSSLKVQDSDRVCFIDCVQVDSDYQRTGVGTKGVRDFIHTIKETYNVNKFALFVQYNEDYYENPDLENGLSRLVNFYKNLGFEQLTPINDNSDQIDMCFILKE